MRYFYLICFVLAFILFLWQILSDERRSVTQHIMLFVAVVANGGYCALLHASNLQEAILAQKIIYIGGCFLPMLYFITVCEICHVNIKRGILCGLYVVQGIVYGSVCTIGWRDCYYKQVQFHIQNGMPYLTKEYGPLHMLYVITMYLYFALALVTVVRAVYKRMSISTKNVVIMLLSFFLAIACYVSERVLGLKFEIMPMAYILLFSGSSLQSYQSNLFTIEENKNIIEEQLSEVGFIAFDRQLRYKGCNAYAQHVFPQLADCCIGKRIDLADAVLQTNIIDGVRRFADNYKHEHHGHGMDTMTGEHEHTPMDTFELDGHRYDCMIHTLQNYRKRYVGFTVEFRDETEHYKALELFANYNKMLEADVAAKTKQIREIQQKTILGMAQMVESRDLSTGGHIKRTSEVVRIFADELSKMDSSLTPEFLQLVIRSAPMHDLGKIGVDDSILRKQGKFTDEEYDKMKEHAANGARIVKDVLTGVEDERFVEVAVNVAHYHHEKVNGKGYPDGLKGEEIPIEARIMALADVFDALVSKRCYKEAFSYDKAFSIIEQDAGTHFDERLAGIFLKCRPQLEKFYNQYGEE